MHKIKVNLAWRAGLGLVMWTLNDQDNNLPDNIDCNNNNNKKLSNKTTNEF